MTNLTKVRIFLEEVRFETDKQYCLVKLLHQGYKINQCARFTFYKIAIEHTWQHLSNLNVSMLNMMKIDHQATISSCGLRLICHVFILVFQFS